MALNAQILMVMSTPAGRLSFFNSSTVLAVGSRMSISRLWVRCSKVSCDFLSAVRRALDGEALDAGRQRDGPGDARAGAFDGVRDFAGRLVYDPVVIGLEANSNALCSHTKNNCLLMV